MSTLHIPSLYRRAKIPLWLELPMSRINFHGPKDVRAIEIYCMSIDLNRYRDQAYMKISSF